MVVDVVVRHCTPIGFVKYTSAPAAIYDQLIKFNEHE